MRPLRFPSCFWFAAPILACLAACDGALFTSPGSGGDAGSGGPSEAGTSTGPCGPNDACPSGSTCLYPIGHCDAKGECIENPDPGTPQCGALELLCGCGQEVTSGCGFPDGYASGPATGSSSCEGTVDGGSPGDPPDSGRDLGPCGAGESCPSGSSCFFPIGNCDAKGECIESPPPGAPECNSIELVCGCGKTATTGCGFPDGFASGPTTGSSSCEMTADGGQPGNPSDAGRDRGPCTAEGTCPAGSSCLYAIGSCTEPGECFENPAPGTPECDVGIAYCACSGADPVFSGCGYPTGYASGPTLGATSCDQGAADAATR